MFLNLYILVFVRILDIINFYSFVFLIGYDLFLFDFFLY